MGNFSKPKESTSVSISSKLLMMIDELCEQKGLSRSGFIEQASMDYILKLMRDDPELWKELYHRIMGLSS